MLHRNNPPGTAPKGHPQVAGALVAALIALSACDNTGRPSAVSGLSHHALQAPASLGDEDLRHFLVRTRFGVTNADLEAVKTKGLPAYIHEMLTFPPVGTPAFEQQAETVLYNPTDPPGLEGGFPTKNQLVHWWLRLIDENPNPFQEVMALFWHDHFAVGSQGLRSNPTATSYWMREHVDLLRGNGTGNVRDLLIDVSRDAAMLSWLDGISNSRDAPNENYAREFWELFTLGVDNGYTQTDVTEAARAFTGYLGIPGPRGQSIVQFFPNLHDYGVKTVLGETIQGKTTEDEFEEVVDVTLRKGAAAEYLCTSLFEYFCYKDPPADIVDDLAAILRDHNWELKPVLEVLLQSNAFFSAGARLSRVKSPVEHAFGFVRSTGMRLPVAKMVSLMWSMGQVPTQPPTVEGWLGGEYWLGSQDIVERANFIATSISARVYQASLGFSWTPLLPPPGQRTAPAVVDSLTALLHVSLTNQDRADCISYLDTEMLENGTVVSSPFVASSSQLDERVRGLLYILAQHPTYMMR